jgi:cytochrome b involved in lipid metabolism
MAEYTLEEIATHNTEESLWLIIGRSVCDVTSFLNDHPGGKKPFLKYAGTDVTEKFAFVKAHKTSEDLPKLVESLKIGTVKL